jgi:hypothetical protein
VAVPRVTPGGLTSFRPFGTGKGKGSGPGPGTVNRFPPTPPNPPPSPRKYVS